MIAALSVRVRALLTRHGGLAGLAGHLWHLWVTQGPGALLERARSLLGGRPVWDRRAEARVRALVPPDGSAPARVAARGFSPGVRLIGHPQAVLGRGEDIRTSAFALQAAGVPFVIRDLFGDPGHQGARLQAGIPPDALPDAPTAMRVNLFVLNADEMASAWKNLDGSLLEGRYNIGYWAWELSRFPEAWRPALRGLHEIWAPSRFIQQAIAEQADCPVLWMPLAVEPHLESPLGRAELGLPRRPFLFLFMFDFRSFVDRKNPWALIEAFDKAFDRDDASVALVIKMNGMNERALDHRAFMRLPWVEDPRIVAIDRVMSEHETRSLVGCCDCFVSLHRSEGFGRGLAEAMYRAKPVIATGYSGNLDFMNADNSCLIDHRLVAVGRQRYPEGAGQIWAEADVGMASAAMRRLVEDPAMARELGTAGARFIRRHHSYAAIGARYRRRLEQLGLLGPPGASADLDYGMASAMGSTSRPGSMQEAFGVRSLTRSEGMR